MLPRGSGGRRLNSRDNEEAEWTGVGSPVPWGNACNRGRQLDCRQDFAVEMGTSIPRDKEQVEEGDSRIVGRILQKRWIPPFPETENRWRRRFGEGRCCDSGVEPVNLRLLEDRQAAGREAWSPGI